MDKVLRLNITAAVYDEHPDYAVIELTPELIARIKQLQKAVKKLDVYCIEEFNYDPLYQDDNGNESDVRVECTCLKVTSDEFLWTGYIKHTGVTWETETVTIKELS